MASGMVRFTRFKLETVFLDETSVVHTTHKSDTRLRQRKVPVKTTWVRETVLGHGAFGVVWREREKAGKGATDGELRAVKIVSKQHINVREVDVLAEMQDVRTPPNTFDPMN